MSNGNGDGNTIDILGPDGATYPMPLDKVPDALKQGGIIKGSQTELAGRALAASGISGPQLQSAATSPSAIPQIPMQQSMAPRIVRGVGAALPVVGGTTGGIVGAGAGGVGAVGGAGVGGMLGEEGRQAINQSLDNPQGAPYPQAFDQPLSAEESAKNIALAGGLSAGAEGAGGLLIGAGGKVLSRVAASQAAKETGSAAAGLAEQTPIGFSAKGLQRSLSNAFENVSQRLSTALQGSQGTTSLSQAIAPVTQRAAQSQVAGVATRLNKIITAAKEVAGIQGDQVTADQLFTFAQEMAKGVYSGNPGPIKAVLNNLQQDAYARLGNVVRSLAPEAAEPLQQLTNLHAARTAVQNYAPGRLGSTLISAALHPRMTAALSPAITAVGAKLGTLKDQAMQVGQEFLP